MEVNPMDIWRRLNRKIRFEWQKLRLQSCQDFCTKVLKSDCRELTAGTDAIRDSHAAYTRSVSHPSMAISLELANVLHGLTQHFRPARILELGSGFSTFVLARSAETWRGDVTTLEDDATWASKTLEFLARQGISNAQVELLQVQGTGQTQYDFVFLDLNFVEVRKNYIELAFSACTPGGLLVFDDIHKSDYLFEVLDRSRKWRVELYDLKAFTLDTYGRYSLAIVKQ